MTSSKRFDKTLPKEYFSITDSYGCFSAYHVALADGLPYRQLFMYIQRLS